MLMSNKKKGRGVRGIATSVCLPGTQMTPFEILEYIDNKCEDKKINGGRKIFLSGNDF